MNSSGCREIQQILIKEKAVKKVTLTFVGFNSDEVAQRFYTWAVDGGLEDS